MLRRIMVPLCGAAFAEAALPTAFLLARRDNARVHLVRVHESRFPAAVPGYPPGYDPTLEQALEREGRRYLDVLLGRITAQERARVVTGYLHGPVIQTLSSYLKEQDIDLVVMTTHARAGMRRALLGSVADGLVRHSHAPVLLLRRQREAAPAPATTAFRRVLVPVDGEPAGDRMIERALEVAGPETEYVLLRVIATRRQHAILLATLESKAEALRARGLAARAHVTVDEDPAHEILRYAAANGVDLVAMATRSRGGVERLVLGSVADRVLHEAELALLLWHPRQGAAVEQVETSLASEEA